MDICLLWVLCVVRLRSLRRADHPSKGILPTVVLRWVWSRNAANEETLAHWGAVAPKKTIHYSCSSFICYGYETDLYTYRNIAKSPCWCFIFSPLPHRKKKLVDHHKVFVLPDISNHTKLVRMLCLKAEVERSLRFINGNTTCNDSVTEERNLRLERHT